MMRNRFQLSRLSHMLRVLAVAVALPHLVAAQMVEPSPEHGFHIPYLLLIPESLRPGAAIVVASPTPPTSENSADYLAAAKRIADNAGALLSTAGIPVLVPVLPRPPLALPNGDFINIYFPALSRAALLASDEHLARMDRQVLAMIEHARARIQTLRNVTVHPKAIFAGFSGGGHFATRIAALHPDRVLVVWAGGMSGHPILPIAEYAGRTLTYPVGIADLEEIAGAPFDRDAYASIPMLIVQGAADLNTSLPSGNAPSESYSTAQGYLVRELFGETPLERIENIKPIFERVNPRVMFRIYPDVGHQITPDVARDVLEFVIAQLPPRPPADFNP
jgi:predicted esterase